MRLATSILFLAAVSLSAQEITTDPLGFNKVTCLNNSDTIVGVPFRKEGSQQTKLSGAPTGIGDAFTLPVAATLTAGQFSKHYVKFLGGAKDGFWYDVTSNTTNSITIDLNGDSLSGVVSGDPVIIAEYWTLDTLFPPVASAGVTGPTTSWTETPPGSGIWVQNGHAIVSSASASQTTRMSEILLPNTIGTGTDRISQNIYYITGNIWRKSGVAGNFGSTVIYPDTFFTLRHRSLVIRPTVFRSIGEVEVKDFIVPLATNVLITGSEKRDTYVGILRPIPTRLDELNLIASGAFATSATTSQTTRRDELLLYANETQLINKIPSAIYYHTGGNWRKTGTSVIQNATEIPAGAGFVIRKYPTVGSTTSNWRLLPPN